LSVVTEQEDCQQEFQHVQTALSACCYPRWSMDLVAKQQRARNVKQVKQTKKARQTSGVQVVVPCVKGLTEAISRICHLPVNRTEQYAMS